MYPLHKKSSIENSPQVPALTTTTSLFNSTIFFAVALAFSMAPIRILLAPSHLVMALVPLLVVITSVLPCIVSLVYSKGELE